MTVGARGVGQRAREVSIAMTGIFAFNKSCAVRTSLWKPLFTREEETQLVYTVILQVYVYI